MLLTGVGPATRASSHLLNKTWLSCLQKPSTVHGDSARDGSYRAHAPLPCWNADCWLDFMNVLVLCPGYTEFRTNSLIFLSPFLWWSLCLLCVCWGGNCWGLSLPSLQVLKYFIDIASLKKQSQPIKHKALTFLLKIEAGFSVPEQNLTVQADSCPPDLPKKWVNLAYLNAD